MQNKTKITLVSLLCIGVFGIVMISGWLFFETIFNNTGDAQFCGGCHEMQPMVLAYEEDVHGGNNAYSVQAQCIQCHLDHTNAATLFITKTKAGIRDYFASTFQDTDKIDWEATRKRRTSFVFDSGCLSCHRALKSPILTTTKAWVAHRPYFMKDTDRSCSSCHPHVGHKNLSMFLSLKRSN